MIRLGVLVSGSGTNLQAILNAIEAKTLDAQVAVVVSNRADAYGLERAKAAKIPAITVDHKAFGSREAFDAVEHRMTVDHQGSDAGLLVEHDAPRDLLRSADEAGAERLCGDEGDAVLLAVLLERAGAPNAADVTGRLLGCRGLWGVDRAAVTGVTPPTSHLPGYAGA